jgi:hydrogenase/urease accessory protein HupE
MINKTTKKIALAVALASLFALLSPSVASAHPIKGVGDFYAGMLHPLTALEFLLPWIALSLFAGQQGRRAALLTLPDVVECGRFGHHPNPWPCCSVSDHLL